MRALPGKDEQQNASAGISAAAAADRVARVEALRYLCRSFYHKVPYQGLLVLARQYGVPMQGVPQDADSVKRHICLYIAGQLGITLSEDEDFTSVAELPVSTTTTVDTERGPCSLQIVRTVSDEVSGSTGLVYFIKGFRECSRLAGAAEQFEDVTVLKTFWARDPLRWSKTRLMYSRFLQEQHTMYVATRDSGTRNVVPMHYWWSGEGARVKNVLPMVNSAWIVMPYYKQGDAMKWICETLNLPEYHHGTRSVGDAHISVHAGLSILCSVFSQMARGLRSLHRLGYVHADFKPENCFVRTEPLPQGHGRAPQSEIEAAGDVDTEPLWPIVDVGDLETTCGVMLEEQVGRSIDRADAHRLARVLTQRSDLTDEQVSSVLMQYAHSLLENESVDMEALKRQGIREQAPSGGAPAYEASHVSTRDVNAALQSAVQRMKAVERTVNWAFSKKNRSGARSGIDLIVQAAVQKQCMVGSFDYLAPEMLTPPLYRCRPKTYEADAWALGVTMLALATCSPPSYPMDLARADGRLEPFIPSNSILARPESLFLRNAISSLMRTDPTRRMNAVDIVDNSLIRRYAMQAARVEQMLRS